MRMTDFPVIGEIREEYRALRSGGCSRAEAEMRLRESYARELADGDDGPVFWVGLADAQHSLQELSEDAAGRALEALGKLPGIARGDLERRRKWYAEIRPERKSIKAPRRFRCAWKTGDTFACSIGGEKAREMGIEGRHILVRKVHELQWSDGRILPAVTLTLWEGEELPRTAAEFASAPMLKMRGDYADCCKSGFIYRGQLLFSGKKQTERFRFLGNFRDVPMPEDEIIAQSAAFTPMLDIRKFDDACCVCWSLHQQYTALAEARRKEELAAMEKKRQECLLETPFGPIRLYVDGEVARVPAEPHGAGCWRVRINGAEGREIVCSLDTLTVGTGSSGEGYHAVEFLRERLCLTIGTETDRVDRLVWTDRDGITVRLLGDAEVVFGIAWVEDHQGSGDVRTWFAADPTLD